MESFNDFGAATEEQIDTEMLPTLLPWEEREINGKTYRVSPPITRNFKSVRLAVNRDSPMKDPRHIDAYAIDVNPDMSEQSPRPLCMLHFTTKVREENALEQIQANWDACARGAQINRQSWWDRVFPSSMGSWDPRMVRAWFAAWDALEFEPPCLHVPSHAEIFSSPPIHFDKKDGDCYMVAKYSEVGIRIREYRRYQKYHFILFSIERREIILKEKWMPLPPRQAADDVSRCVFADPVRKDARTARWRSIPAWAEDLQIIELGETRTDRVGKSRSNGFSYVFHHELVRFRKTEPSCLHEELLNLFGEGLNLSAPDWIRC